MRDRGCHTIADLRLKAKARLPRVAFDFLDGGAGSEAGLARNCAALQDVRLLPRVMTGCAQRSIGCELFGETFAAPFGVAPTGLTNLMWPGGDRGLARAARQANIPYIISTPATSPLEALAELAGPRAWFQLYVGRDPAIVDDLIARAEVVGVPVLVVTVDVPAPGKRLRDLRNGFSLPLRPSLRGIVDFAAHPHWTLATLREGLPRFANYERYAAPGVGTQALAALMSSQSSARFDWTDLQKIRDRWPRKLVVKGILHPDDAQRAVDMGVDGIVVSNHGGRQLDAAPATIDMLPLVRAAVGRRAAVLFDGGLRGGEDIAKALALGADFVLLGRAFLYGVGALGPEAGPRRVLDILTGELDCTLAQLGVRSIAELGPGHILSNAQGPHTRFDSSQLQKAYDSVTRP